MPKKILIIIVLLFFSPGCKFIRVKTVTDIQVESDYLHQENEILEDENLKLKEQNYLLSKENKQAKYKNIICEDFNILLREELSKCKIEQEQSKIYIEPVQPHNPTPEYKMIPNVRENNDR